MSLFNKTYEIKGKHGDMVRQLTNALNCRNYDIFLISVSLGISRGLTASPDVDSKKEPVKIDIEQIIYNTGDIEFFYRMLMLSDEKYCPSAKERGNKAFRYIGTEAGLKDEMYFTKVMLGGLEMLYDQIYVNTAGQKDIFRNINDFLISCDDE